MHTFRAAQPALLYLSPACIFSVLLLAAARGEVSDLLAYTEESESSEKRENDEQDRDSEVSDEEGDAHKAKGANTSENGQTLERKTEEVLNGQAGDATAWKRRTTRSTAKLAEPQAL
jgi:minor histocompatibility antigen H13